MNRRNHDIHVLRRASPTLPGLQKQAGAIDGIKDTKKILRALAGAIFEPSWFDSLRSSSGSSVVKVRLFPDGFNVARNVHEVLYLLVTNPPESARSAGGMNPNDLIGLPLKRRPCLPKS